MEEILISDSLDVVCIHHERIMQVVMVVVVVTLNQSKSMENDDDGA